MIKTFMAVFNGEALIPDEPLEIPPDTRVLITLEEPGRPTGEPYSSLKLQGLSPTEIFELATNVYSGLSEEDIAEIEQIALRRGVPADPDPTDESSE